MGNSDTSADQLTQETTSQAPATTTWGEAQPDNVFTTSLLTQAVYQVLPDTVWPSAIGTAVFTVLNSSLTRPAQVTLGFLTWSNPSSRTVSTGTTTIDPAVSDPSLSFSALLRQQNSPDSEPATSPDTNGKTGGEPSQQGHTDSKLAGAVIGSFVGGAMSAMLLMVALLAWKKRRDRQRRRDQQIQDSFAGGSARRDTPFEDIILSSTSEKKPLNPPAPEQKSAIAHALSPSGPGHIVTQVCDPEQQDRDGTAPSAPVTTGVDAAEPSIKRKRQSFPEALQIGAPRRTISISAVDLISPVAATQPAQDQVKQLRLQASTLFEQIELHVDNFYHSQRIAGRGPELAAAQQGRLQRFDSPHLDDSIAGLLPYAEDARTLLKHCMAEIMVSRLDYTSRVDASEALLPSSLLGMYRLMVCSPKNEGGLDLKQWRIQTVSLLGIENIERSMGPEVRALAADVTKAFQPWALSRYGNEARSSHLGKILTEAVELGLEIFGMQNEVKWSWAAEASGQIVVFPGLVIELDRGADAAVNGTGQVEVVQPVRNRVRFAAPSNFDGYSRCDR